MVSLLASIRNVAVAAGAFLATAALIRRAPDLEQRALSGEPVLSAKMRLLEEDDAGYDAVFVGSSLVYRDVSPLVFDETLGESGRTLRSFNFGAPGMWMPESIATLEWILEHGAAAPRFAFVELRAFTEPTASNRMTRRRIRWHTARATWLACRRAWHTLRSPVKRVRAITGHIAHFAARVSNFGVGPAYVASWRRATARRRALLEGPSRDGFLPFDVVLEMDEFRERREDFLADTSVFRDRIAALKSGASDRWMNRYDVEALDRVVELGRSHDVEVVFVALPRTDLRMRLDDPEERYTLIDLGDPHEHPALFKVQRFFDRGHLNTLGARLCSTLLANAFLQLRAD